MPKQHDRTSPTHGNGEPNREIAPPVGAGSWGVRRELLVAGGYILYFALLFLQFPVAGRIPGNCDTWYVITFPNIYLNEIGALLGGEATGSFFYPIENPLAYGETAALLAVVPMLFRLLGLSDLLTSYGFTCLVYAMTAFATFRVATLYVNHRATAVFAGFALATCNFTLSTIDSPHTVFLGVLLLSFYYYKRYLSEERPRLLWISALLAGAQTYLSAYGFLILAIALGTLTVVHGRQIIRHKAILRALAIYGLVVSVFAAPFYLSYLVRLTDYFSWRSQAVMFAELIRRLKEMPDQEVLRLVLEIGDGDRGAEPE